jgi:hypothetical protein
MTFCISSSWISFLSSLRCLSTVVALYMGLHFSSSSRLAMKFLLFGPFGLKKISRICCFPQSPFEMPPEVMGEYCLFKCTMETMKRRKGKGEEGGGEERGKETNRKRCNASSSLSVCDLYLFFYSVIKERAKERKKMKEGRQSLSFHSGDWIGRGQFFRLIILNP